MDIERTGDELHERMKIYREQRIYIDDGERYKGGAGVQVGVGKRAWGAEKEF